MFDQLLQMAVQSLVASICLRRENFDGYGEIAAGEDVWQSHKLVFTEFNTPNTLDVGLSFEASS